MSEEYLRAVFIHGTFARKAEWVKETSPLAVALKGAFPGIKTINALYWRGWNTFNARLRGADQLILLLDSLRESEQAVICAHSHGGSVLCYALQKRPDLANKVRATVFLATPFYSCRLLPSWQVLFDGLFAPIFYGIYLLGLVSVFIVSLSSTRVGHIMPLFFKNSLPEAIYLLFLILFEPLFTITQVLQIATGNQFTENEFIIPLIIVVLIAEASLRTLLYFNRRKLILARRCLGTALRVAQKVSCELPPGVRSLFIRFEGDEASAALTLAQTVSWVVTSVNVLYARVIWIFMRPLSIVRLHHPILFRAAFAVICLGIEVAFFMYFKPIFDEVFYYLNLDAVREVNRGRPDLIRPPPNPATTEVFSFLGWHVTESALQYAVVWVAALMLAAPPFVFVASATLLTINWLISICFGIIPPFVAGMLQPAINETPPGTWEVRLVSWRSYGRKIRMPFWRHSNPYSEPRVISEIVEWIGKVGVQQRDTT